MNLLGKKTIFALFILVIIFYGVFRTQSFRNGPVIYLNNPGFTSTIEDIYTVQFDTKNIDKIFINGKKVLLDTEGKLRGEVILFDGINDIEIRFYDKYQREGIEKITVFKD